MALYYESYNGSLTDRTNRAYVVAGANTVGLGKITIVLDGGFWSKRCITNLFEHSEAFTVGRPGYLQVAKDTVSKYRGDVKTYANQLLEYPNIYCVENNKTIWGIKGKILLYFDSQAHVNGCAELMARLERLKEELYSLKRYPKGKLKKYQPYFRMTQKGNGFDYEVDTDKVERLRSRMGFFLLFSNDMVSTPSDHLYYYRAKDADEKLFAQIKVEMEGYRIRTHNSITTEGKIFTVFIASILRSALLGKSSPYLIRNSTSLKKVIAQLADVKIISINGGVMFTKALTNTADL